MKKIILSGFTILLLSSFLTGCNDSDSSSTSISTIDGKLVDNYIKDIEYTCGDSTTGFTDTNGNFSCSSFPITFKLDNLNLGTIDSLNIDGMVFPQDIVGVDRTDTGNEKVIVMAQFLQSLDTDNDLTNGIDIDETKLDLFKNDILENEDFDEYNTLSYLEDNQIQVRTREESKLHLEETLNEVELIESMDLNTEVKAAIESIEYDLTDEIKKDLLYMGNEERLAYDVYQYLYNLYPTSEQFNTISTNSETQHINAVKALVLKYNIDLSTADGYVENTLVNPDSNINDIKGEYNIQAITDLYNNLTLQGSSSEIEALKVGCIIEVVDVTDLDKSIADLEGVNAEDVDKVFDFLRNGSYNHYWSFDKGLKNNGIVDGCCSIGTEYCHPEYPQNEKGKGSGDGNGEQKRKGKH